MSELPQPVNLTLTSKHFHTELKWEPGPGTPRGVCYNITFNTDREVSWRPVPGCQLVQYPLVCNLTKVFSDPNKTYLSQVITLLGTQKSQPASYSGFKLIRDSQLDLPLLTVTPCDMSLCVELQLPMLYKLDMSQHYRDIYNSSLTYKLRIDSNNAEVQFQEDIRYLQKFIVTPVVPGRLYCVSVCFLDRLLPKLSNYSQPVCAFIPGIFYADPWISAGLCVLVIFGVVVVAFLFSTGSICLSKRPLPLVLTSVLHIGGGLVNTASSMSLSSIMTVKATLPSSGKRRHKRMTSEESDEESETESTRGEYKLWVGANLSSSSSSSSPCLSAPVCPKPEPKHLLSPTQTLNSAETHSFSALSTHTNADRGTVGTTEPDEEEKEVLKEGGSQDVNLLTLTFGRHREEGEEQESHLDVANFELETPFVIEECNITSVQPSQPGEGREVTIETVSCSVDEEEGEEEEEEGSEYMGRSFTAVLQRSL
ncbi:interferon alpha/beta receptor 2-like isoform X2 [Anabas testudineus]|nr:interferon alpha/beta receptor 2-like isoform X2 [Anabas testudineus]